VQPEPTVFLVDDDPAVVKALRTLVESIDLKVESYGSTDDFLEAYRPSRPGCLVLDLRMPGIDGLELQGKLAADGISLPIVFITGRGDVRAKAAAMEAGAVAFLEKPFRMQELCDAIQKAIRLDEQNRHRRRQ